MALSAEELRRLLASPKQLGRSPRWDERSDPNRLSFTAPLSTGEIVPEGLQLRAAALKRVWDRAVMFQLEVMPARRKVQQFYRVEWRPVRVHTNKECGPRDLRLLEINGSHEHTLDDNCIEGEDRLRASNLSVARPLDRDPQSFEQLLEFVAERFKIDDIKRVPVPPWSGGLF